MAKLKFKIEQHLDNEDDVNICIDLPRNIGDRIYEEVVDDYFYLSQVEFDALFKAMKAFKKKGQV